MPRDPVPRDPVPRDPVPRDSVPRDSVPIVDAHAHFWDLEARYYPWLRDPDPIRFRYGDYGPLRRSYLPEDYRRDSRDFTVAGLVHVEAEHDPRDPLGETRWLSDLATRSGLPTACVCQAWLDRGDLAEVLAAQAEFPLVRGIRHKPASVDEPREAVRGAPGSMDDPLWRRGYAQLSGHGLSFDLQTPYWHLDAAAELAADFPETRMIVNHTGLPADRSPEGLSAWRIALETVAARDNVALKISGLGQLGRPWTVAENGPVVRDAIAIFGVARCMFASNFPVDSLVADYGTVYSGFREIAAELAADFPETRMIVNHTGLPADRSPEGLAAWRAALETVAARDNVALKISGLGQLGRPWTVAENGPVVRDAIAIFGVARCMFASNFPVDSLVADYGTVYSGFREIAAEFPPDDIDKLFHHNAVRHYRLDQKKLETGA